MQANMQEEIDRILADKDNIQYTLSQMVALMNDTDAKVDAMKSQKWYQRMIKTVFGKNKATKEEIASNHDKLNAYMAKVIAELFKRIDFTEKQLVSLGNQINQVYENIPEIKEIIYDSVTELNAKIASLDTYVVLTQKISVGYYTGRDEICSLFDVVARIDNRVAVDDEKTNIICCTLMNKLNLEAEKTLSEYMTGILYLSADAYEPLYANAVSIGGGALWARLVMQVIEQYHFLPAAEKKALAVETVVENIMATNLLKGETKFSLSEIYDNLLEERVNQAENTETISPDSYEQSDDSVAETPSEAAKREATEGNSLPNKISENCEDYTPKSELVDTESQEMGQRETIDFAEITISDAQHIAKGETKRYFGKTIHFSAKTECEGTLEFDTCVLHYNESDFPDEIMLSYEGALHMKNCTVINHALDRQFFIDACRTEKELSFTNCEFINCAYFLNSEKVVFSSCKIINPGLSFICCWSSLITNCEFLYESEDNIRSFLKAPPSFFIDDIMHLGSKSSVVHCRFTGKLPLGKDARKAPRLIYVNSGTINGCTFYNCKNAVTGTVQMTDCRFDKCIDAITVAENSKLSFCQFNYCKGRVIDSGLHAGGTEITYCDFNYWKSGDNSNSSHDGPMITLQLWKDYPSCTIEKCTFAYADAEKYYLIMGKACEKLHGRCINVRDCSFIKCATEHDSHQLLKHTDDYFAHSFSKKTTEQKIVYVYNCRGLDDVLINEKPPVDGKFGVKENSHDGTPLGVISAVGPAIILPSKIAE